MIKWLLKTLGYELAEKAPPAPEPKRQSGFFSTDSPVGVRALTDEEQQTVLSRSVQVVPKNESVEFALGGADKTEVQFQTIANDSNWGNTLKGTFSGGFGGISDVQASWYASQGFIGYQMCAVIAQHWLVDKACSVPGEDAVRNWFKLSFTGTDGENTEAITTMVEAWDKKLNLRHNLEQFVRFNRIFGIRHALFVVKSDDPQYYEKPFNPDGVKPGSYKGISQIDPIWVTPELDADATANPVSMHFYDPTYYRINGKRYHRSHLVVIRGGEVPDVLKPTYFYGGISIPQRIYERVYSAERVANEAPMLLMTKRLNVIHTDVEKALANPVKFQERMQEWLFYRDNYGIKIAGEREVIEQFDTTLTDFDETVMTQFQLVAAIAGTPVTKLLGTSPKGFNATGEYDESSYHETLESLQTHQATPLVQRHHQLVMLSYVAPQLLSGKAIPLGITWNKTDAPTEKEVAETNKLKAETGNQLVTSGAITPDEERERINNDPDSGYNGLPTIDPAQTELDEEVQAESDARVDTPV